MSTPSNKARAPTERTAKDLRDKYPDRIPVIVSKSQSCNLNEIDKCKYLVPDNYTVGQFVYIIRKRIVIPKEKAIFIFFIENVLFPTSALMSEMYDKYKDKDGFLYITYSGENTFGI